MPEIHTFINIQSFKMEQENIGFPTFTEELKTVVRKIKSTSVNDMSLQGIEKLYHELRDALYGPADTTPKTFVNELTSLVNQYSLENASNTPDFILSKFVLAAINAMNVAVYERDKFYGVKLQPGGISIGEGLGIVAGETEEGFFNRKAYEKAAELRKWHATPYWAMASKNQVDIDVKRGLTFFSIDSPGEKFTVRAIDKNKVFLTIHKDAGGGYCTKEMELNRLKHDFQTGHRWEYREEPAPINHQAQKMSEALKEAGAALHNTINCKTVGKVTAEKNNEVNGAPFEVAGTLWRYVKRVSFEEDIIQAFRYVYYCNRVYMVVNYSHNGMVSMVDMAGGGTKEFSSTVLAQDYVRKSIRRVEPVNE